MIRKRIIPVLLIHKGGLYKTKKFSDPIYVGDPINAVRIFNEKRVDELILLDIDASKNGNGPNIEMISDIVSEAFMPVAYGGGISTLGQAEKLFFNGVEKIILNSALFDDQSLLEQITSRYGNQSVIASIDVKTTIFKKQKVFSHAGKKHGITDILSFAKRCADNGVGEIMINSVDRDGTYSGYDLPLLSKISDGVDVPVIVCGGASSKEDFIDAEKCGASAMAAGSMFVFQRPHNAVLISYNV